MKRHSPDDGSTPTTSGSPRECSSSLSDQRPALFDQRRACTVVHSTPAWRCMCASKRAFRVLSKPLALLRGKLFRFGICTGVLVFETIGVRGIAMGQCQTLLTPDSPERSHPGAESIIFGCVTGQVDG